MSGGQISRLESAVPRDRFSDTISRCSATARLITQSFFLLVFSARAGCWGSAWRRGRAAMRHFARRCSWWCLLGPLVQGQCHKAYVQVKNATKATQRFSDCLAKIKSQSLLYDPWDRISSLCKHGGAVLFREAILSRLLRFDSSPYLVGMSLQFSWVCPMQTNAIKTRPCGNECMYSWKP